MERRQVERETEREPDMSKGHPAKSEESAYIGTYVERRQVEKVIEIASHRWKQIASKMEKSATM